VLVTDDLKYAEVIALLKEIRAIVSTSSKVWLTPEEAGAYIGATTPSIYRYLRNGSIPHHHIPGSRMIRFHVTELDEWMRTGTVTDTQSINELLRRLEK
jgi:excisionase family DNA binding protein